MADYTYIAPYTYNGVTYNRGDALVVTGDYFYTINSTSRSGSVSGATKYFYGYAQMNDGSAVAHPLGLMNSASHSSVTFAQMDMSAIQSGGTRVEYTVTINLNGGTATDNFTSFPVIVGTNTWYVFNGYQPTRKGYTFKGLYTAASGGTQIYNKDGLAVGDSTYWTVSNGTYTWKYAGNVTLYAQWTGIKYYIKYNGNGSTSGSMSNSTHVYGTAKALTANAFSKTGYTFSGWNTKSDGSGTALTNKHSITGLTTTSGATVNIYAQWKINQYTLTINPNGGTWGGTTSNSTAKQNYNSTKTIANPTREGYTFGGWTLSGSGSLSGTTYTYGAGNGTLTAKWTANKYTITYKANGGTGDDVTQTATYGTSWTTKGAIFTKTGYTQTSWNTKADGSGTTYSLNASQTNKQLSNLTLYAIYGSANSYTYNIVYKSSTGVQLGSNSATHEYGTTNSISPKAFTGYTSPAAQSVTWDSTSAKTITFTYTPITYTISYTLNSGTERVANPTSYTVETPTFTLVNPMREGYLFTGWTGSNGTTANTSVSIAKGSTGNLSYTANWRELTKDERKTLVYYDGTMEAALFIESDEKFGISDTGTVYASEFVETDSNWRIDYTNKKMYFKEFKEKDLS